MTDFNYQLSIAMKTPTANNAIYFNSKAVVAHTISRVKTNISCGNWVSELVLFNFSSVTGRPCKHLEQSVNVVNSY